MNDEKLIQQLKFFVEELENIKKEIDSVNKAIKHINSLTIIASEPLSQG